MKTVYYKSGEAEWKYELEDDQYDEIIEAILEDETDPEEMLQDSLEILRDVADLADDELTEDDVIDQTTSIAYLWYYFNSLPEGNAGRIEGDIVLLETEDGEGVAILSASEIAEEEDEE